MIIKTLPVGLFMANCYLVACPQTKDCVIIDPGSDGKAIIEKTKQLDVHVRYIINTHAHIDHIGANSEVSAAFAAPILGHKADLPLFHSRSSGLALGPGKTELKSPDQFVQEGEILPLGNLQIKVLATPGHSPGGISLEIGGALFTGDTLFSSSIGRTDLPGGSYREIICSIKEKLLPYADETVVYPGHGPPTTIGDERRHNPFLA